MKRRTLLLLPIVAISFLYAAEKTKNPVEAGKVTWLRDYDEATKKAEETGKPIFLLFQEIPG